MSSPTICFAPPSSLPHHPRNFARVASRPRLAMTSAPGYELRAPTRAPPHPRGPLSPSDISHFYNEGFVIARAILPPSTVDALRAGSDTLSSAMENNVYNKLAFRAHATHPAFHHTATASPLAAAAAQLIRHAAALPDADVVVLKDAYFRLAPGNVGCDFHVDDAFFWPCPSDAPGPGVNAWVALDDVGEEGGGLAIAPRSHTQDFLECREAIKGATCEIARLAPALKEKLESIAIAPLVKAGDAILCTRWLFHRGDPFRNADKDAEKGIRRYSVRYMPAEAMVEDMTFKDGKVEKEDPVRLGEADEERFPRVCA